MFDRDREILKLAATLEQEKESREPGLSNQQLLEVGISSGIPAECVMEAIERYDASNPEIQSKTDMPLPSAILSIGAGLILGSLILFCSLVVFMSLKRQWSAFHPTNVPVATSPYEAPLTANPFTYRGLRAGLPLEEVKGVIDKWDREFLGGRRLTCSPAVDIRALFCEAQDIKYPRDRNSMDIKLTVDEKTKIVSEITVTRDYDEDVRGDVWSAALFDRWRTDVPAKRSAQASLQQTTAIAWGHSVEGDSDEFLRYASWGGFANAYVTYKQLSVNGRIYTWNKIPLSFVVELKDMESLRRAQVKRPALEIAERENIIL